MRLVVEAATSIYDSRRKNPAVIAARRTWKILPLMVIQLLPSQAGTFRPGSADISYPQSFLIALACHRVNKLAPTPGPRLSQALVKHIASYPVHLSSRLLCNYLLGYRVRSQ